jgi:hypothetical protein
MKKSFNIGLVEVESHVIVSKKIFLTTFFGHYNVFHPLNSNEVHT